jgi:4-amino-4-deoxy-L-arabinose transferase-like glycosyltransferase
MLLLEYLRLGRASVAERGASGAALVLGVGCGLGALVKLSFLPLFGLATLTVMWSAIRRRRLTEVIAFVLGAAIVIPNFAFNWYYRGSPFYPFRILESLPHNSQLSHVLGDLNPTDVWPRVSGALTALVVNRSAEDPFLNMGFAGVVLLILGVAGATQMWRQPSVRPYLICVGISGLVTIAQLVSPSNASMLTVWAAVLARFVVPSVAAIMILAARFPVAVRWVLLPVLVVEYFAYAPWQWPRQLVMASASLLVAFLVVALAALALQRKRVRYVLRWAVLTALVVFSLAAAAIVHERVRYGSYLSFASRQLDDFHGAGRIGTWPIWLRLDESGPSRVAMAAGWDGVGHNWFRYGLLGARLDHDVRYVPLTADGSIVSYSDTARLAASASREAWLRRLEDLRIDWVVALGPRTLEHEWLEGLPEVFSVELTLENRAWILARVNKQTLRSHLRSTQ